MSGLLNNFNPIILYILYNYFQNANPMLEGDEYGIAEDDVTGVVSFLAGPGKLSIVIKFYFYEIYIFCFICVNAMKKFTTNFQSFKDAKYVNGQTISICGGYVVK